jgi:hypothetical protein
LDRLEKCQVLTPFFGHFAPNLVQVPVAKLVGVRAVESDSDVVVHFPRSNIYLGILFDEYSHIPLVCAKVEGPWDVQRQVAFGYS